MQRGKRYGKKTKMNKVNHTDAVSLLGSLSSESVPLIIADPPYGIAYHSNYHKERNPHKPMTNDWDFDPSIFFDASALAMKDGGAMYVFTRWDVYPLWMSWVQKPLKVKNLIVWKKDNWSAGDLKGDFGNQYECIMFITKGRHLLRGHRWSNVWEYSRIPSKKLRHPAEKPVDMVRRMVESSSDEGDLVVDPFCGSGTIGEAAKMCDRDFLMGDIDPNMIRMSCGRLGLDVPIDLPEDKKEVPKCPVFDIVPPNFSLWGLHPEDMAELAKGMGRKRR